MVQNCQTPEFWMFQKTPKSH